MTLSPPQRGLWALDQLAPRRAFYNVAVAYRLRGPLDEVALRQAVETVVGRHEVLRTSIVSEGGAPVARPRPAREFRLEVADLSDLPEGRRDAEVLRRGVAGARRPFDLATELPSWGRLLRLSGDDHLLSLTFHHVAADEASVRLVLQEIAHAYAGEPLPPVRAQYSDVAQRGADARRGEDLDVLLAYWRKTLRGAPASMRLPTDRPAPPVPTFKGATVDFELPAASALDDAGLLTTFAVLLHRYTSHDDLVLGWSVDGRTGETRDVVGTFVNVLPLRVDLSGDPSFERARARVGTALDGLTRHAELPFETLVEELRPGRDPAHNPLFQVAMAVADAPRDEALELPGVDVEAVPLDVSTARFDLFLDVERTNGGVNTSFELATDVFDVATVRALGRHWTNVARAAVAGPDVPISRLPLLDDAERQEVVGRFAGGDLPDDLVLVPDAIAARAESHPDDVAVVTDRGRLTYAELDRDADAVAAALVRRGVAHGSVVALLVERGLPMVPSMLGILRAGCAYLPLDPSYPPRRLTFMLEDSGAAALLGDARPPGLRIPPGVGVIESADSAASAPRRGLHPHDAAYVIYTSGSTGRPKGVVVEHASLARFTSAIAREFALTPRDRVLQFSSLGFDTAVEEIWPTLTAGATLVLRDRHAWDPEELARKVDELGITVLDLPTAYWHELASACAEGIDVRDRPSLRLVVIGGEAMSPARTRLWLESSPRPVRLSNTYGPTETTVTATAFDVTDSGESVRSIPIGRPLAGVGAYVLDGSLEPIPPGVMGELFVGGAGVARGYLGRPALTAERFLPDPFAARRGARMYRTGDRARLRRDGVLEFAGRTDHQVKVRGFRIEPGEVEAALAAHDAVEHAVVVASSGDNPGLVGYLVGTADPSALREWLRDRLPEHMIPSAFVEIAELPLTPSGKVDRNALAAREPDAPARDVVAPRTPAEEVLTSIWQKLLGAEHVGIHASFFDLGGHSLLATQLVSRIRHDFGVSLPLRTVFEWPTIAGLAAVIEGAAADAHEYDELPLEPVERGEALPLSFAQQRLWFIDQFKPGSADYVIAARAELRGALDVDALRRALTALAERHEALRTTFPSHGGEARQVVAADAEVAFEMIDLPGVAAEDIVEREAARPFDLATGPLWRTALIRLERERHVFVTCMHHIVSDGWSLGILASELSEL
ncbi:MAG: amino acid adenylation domain-containing protein, partial [Actinomycetota bacterium]|nr:amino acid adenylation domain-containing protein [Actinomycetota bacterium]